MHRVLQWWREPDRFDWLSGYLDERRLVGAARVSIAGLTALFSAEYAVMLLSSVGPHTAGVRVTLAATAAGGFVLAALWLWRWPTLNQSRAFVVSINVGIAVACLSMSDPIVGISGTFAFIVVGFYGALFHCAKAAMYNVAVTVTVGAILLSRAISNGQDLVLAGCEFAVLIVLSIGSPYMINTMMRLIASDIARLDFDALTGLLNRRGFYRRTGRLIDQHADTDPCHLTIAMIDLDHFKQLNDDHGHAAGDRALIDVGHALQGSAGTAAVVARAGGEEFLVADVSASQPLPFAARLCDAVANTPHGITASIGSTVTTITELRNGDKTSVIDTLIAHADTAMYIAKAAGGNQHRLHQGQPH